jgi:hypothetical protein
LLKIGKVESLEYKEDLKATGNERKLLKIGMDEIVQQQISLENWVEKYLPLKVHTNLAELLEEVIDEEKRQ